MHTADKIGLPEMRRILDGNGIKYVELEFLLNWFEEGERRQEIRQDALRDFLSCCSVRSPKR